MDKNKMHLFFCDLTLLLFILLGVSSAVYGNIPCKHLECARDSSWFDCWDDVAEKSLAELNNKLNWLQYYRACTVIKRHSMHRETSSLQNFAEKKNKDNHQAYEYFAKFMYRSCKMQMPTYSGGMGRDALYAMCIHTLTTAYISYLEEFDFPQGWENYYAEYLLLSPEQKDIEQCLADIKPGYVSQKAA